jgi:ribonuclease E
MPIKSRSRLRRDPHLDYAESDTSDDDRSPKSDRAKSSRSDSSSDRDTASIVSVEMTPEEQEVYALMGISPLVRLNRTIDNPKSTIVSVKSPGETQEDADSGNGQSQSDASPELSASESNNEPETSESNDTPPITRRRRRRSSASDSNESS